jgi:hypothetical protein
MKEKISKEMQDIINAIKKLFEKHNGNVSFVGSFVAFDKNGKFKEDRLFIYGGKEVLKEQIYALAEEISKNKEELVNI